MEKGTLQVLITGKNSTVIRLATLALVLMIGTMAAWAYAGSEPIATVEVDASEIAFVPVAEGENHMLSVSGDNGVYYQEEFIAGEVPVFPLENEEGPFPDGSYRFELRTQPVIDQEALEEAELAGDDRLMEAIARAEEEQVRIQTGTFEIVDGTVVLPEEPEEETAESEEGEIAAPEPREENGPGDECIPTE